MMTGETYSTSKLDSRSGPTRCIRLLPSRNCFCLALGGLPKRVIQDDELLAYQVEDALACDSEDLVVKGWNAGDERTIVVGAIINVDEPEPGPERDEGSDDGVSSLSELGEVTVAMIPIALVHLEASLSSLSNDSGWIRIIEDDGCNLIQLENGLIVQWKWYQTGSDQRDVKALLGKNTLTNHEKELVGEPSEKSLPLLSILDTGDPDLALEVKEHLDGICSGKTLSRHDLQGRVDRRNSQSRLLNGVLAATLSLVAIGTIGLLISLVVRYQSINTFVDASQEQLNSSYREAFPDGPIPVGALSRLQSEHRRLKAVHSTTGSISVESAIPTWFATLRAFPDHEQRFLIRRIGINGDQIEQLSGTSLKASTIELLYERLREEGFSFPNPPGEREGRNWRIRVEGAERRDVEPSDKDVGGQST